MLRLHRERHGAIWWRDGTLRPPAPSLFSWTYPAGALLFSTAFLVKVIGLRIESVILARFTFGALVSVGGALLMVAMVSGAAIARGLVRGKPESAGSSVAGASVW